MSNEEYRIRIKHICMKAGGYEGNSHRISKTRDMNDNFFWLIEKTNSQGAPHYGVDRDIGMFEDFEEALNIFCDAEPNIYKA